MLKIFLKTQRVSEAHATALKQVETNRFDLDCVRKEKDSMRAELSTVQCKFDDLYKSKAILTQIIEGECGLRVEASKIPHLEQNIIRLEKETKNKSRELMEIKVRNFLSLLWTIVFSPFD